MRFALTIIVCLSAATWAVAGWADNFDAYSNGMNLNGQNGWTTWDANPAATAFVTNAQSFSAPYAVDVSGATDLVHMFSGANAGRWVFSALQYIPTDFHGDTYVNLMSVYNHGGPYAWASQVHFGNSVVSDFDGSTLPLIKGQWVPLVVDIDLAHDVQTFYYNGQVLYQHTWTGGVVGGNPLLLSAVDLYANNASPVYYDNMALLQVVPAPAAALLGVVGMSLVGWLKRRMT